VQLLKWHSQKKPERLHKFSTETAQSPMRLVWHSGQEFLPGVIPISGTLAPCGAPTFWAARVYGIRQHAAVSRGRLAGRLPSHPKAKKKPRWEWKAGQGREKWPLAGWNGFLGLRLVKCGQPNNASSAFANSTASSPFEGKDACCRRTSAST